MTFEELDRTAVLYDVTSLGDCTRCVVNMEQFMGALGDEDVRALVESAREGALVERRRRDLAVDREPALFLAWTCARGLISRVLRSANRSRLVVPAAEASLKRETAMLVSRRVGHR